MSDAHDASSPDASSGAALPVAVIPAVPRAPFPWLRLFYAIFFAILASVLFWLIVMLLAPLQFIVRAVTGRWNDELKRMSLRSVHYLVEVLVFVTAARDEKPFPLGPFPGSPSSAE
jgi:hypothetical protein